MTSTEHSILIAFYQAMISCKNNPIKRKRLIELSLNDRSLSETFITCVHRFDNLKTAKEVLMTANQLKLELI